MQQLIKERHKDDVVNVTQRNSIYQTIDRLLRDGLVEVESTARAENRPERTTYRITDAGRATLREWLDAMLSTPAREYPEFPAALSFLPSLSPAEAIAALTARRVPVEEQSPRWTTKSPRAARSCPDCSSSSPSTSARSSRPSWTTSAAWSTTCAPGGSAGRYVDGAPRWPG